MTALALVMAVQAQLPSIDLPPEISRVLTDYESAWMAKSGPRLASLFAEDGFVLSPYRPPVRGRNAIEKHYTTNSGGDLALRAFAYNTEGSIGYIIGGYASKKGDPDGGKFTLTLVKKNGRWLIMSDMDNGNQPRRGD